MTVKDLCEKIKNSQHELDFQLLEKAANFTKLAHAGKLRPSGEPPEEHCLRVAETLFNYRMVDSKAMAAAIMHDVLDEGAANFADLEKEFGEEVADIVKKVSELKIIKLPKSQATIFAENLRKMFLAMAADLRIVLVKLADILDNLRTAKFLPAASRLNLAKETLEIFAPLANRLGIGELKGQLEDLAFPIAYPAEFEQTKKISQKAYLELNKILAKVKWELGQALGKEDIAAEIHGRAKHIYSLYKKLARPEIGNDLSKIYDLVALRIIVDSVANCYQVLGIIHKLWRPLPNYVRDYIASPKPNGYRSIHTTVFGPRGRPFEVQIRTRVMHEEAENGIAAHWHYVEEKQKSGRRDLDVQKGFLASSDKLRWVKELTRWSQEIEDQSEFLKSLKIDVFADRVFVFTPKGDVKDLPAGATPIDFAYSVHTKLGDLAAGAVVDGKMVPLNYQLKSGEVCEILPAKSQHHKPSPHWLEFVKTNLAKREIKKQLA